MAYRAGEHHFARPRPKELLFQSGRDLSLLALGALLYTLGPPPHIWSGVAWFALAPLFFVLREKTPRAGFLLGFCYALFCCLGITRWIYFASASYFHLAFPWDYLFTLGAWAVFGGVYTGVAAMLICRVLSMNAPRLACVAVPALWVSIEAVRSYWGFSWVILGYTQYRNPTLIQIADVTGVYGVSFLMALTSYACAAVATFLRHRSSTAVTVPAFPWFPVVGAALAFLGVWFYGVVRMQQYASLAAPSVAPVRVAIVLRQSPGAQRWMPEHYARTLLRYTSATQQGLDGQPPQPPHRPHLIIWPEFAVGFHLNQDSMLRAQLSRFVQTLNTFLLLGAPRVEASPSGSQYYNSAYLLTPTGEPSPIYDKIRLVPFAEYQPFSAVTGASLPHNGAPQAFTAGSQSTIFPFPQGDFGVVICYEATYPALAWRLVRNGARFLVNISNDAWMAAGGPAAVEQHFSMVVFRAVETKRYVVRAATAGLSGFVDPIGRPVSVSATEDGVLFGDLFPLREITRYARYGDWFVVACAGFSVCILLFTRRPSLG